MSCSFGIGTPLEWILECIYWNGSEMDRMELGEDREFELNWDMERSGMGVRIVN